MPASLFKNIAFCTDFSEHADEAFLTAQDLAWRYGAKLHIIHIMASFSFAPPIHAPYVPMEYEPQLTEQVTEASREAIQTRYLNQLDAKQAVEIHLFSGYASLEILRLAKEQAFDLIVMGSHGLTGLAHVLFGSTADRVVRKAPCSVMTIRLRHSEK